MPIGTGVSALLLADPTVSGLIGTKIFPWEVPQGTVLPAVSYQQTGNERVRSLSGPSGRARPRLQIDVYADTYDLAHQISDAIRQVLDGYSGPAGTYQIDGSILDGDRDAVETQGQSSAVRITNDYLFSHPET